MRVRWWAVPAVLALVLMTGGCAGSFGAPTCVAGMDTFIGKVTDRKGFATYTLKPSGKWPGVVVKGDSAEFGGSCTGWTGGEVESGYGPGKLGHLGLKKTGEGWLFNDHRLPNTSCGG